MYNRYVTFPVSLDVLLLVVVSVSLFVHEFTQGAQSLTKQEGGKTVSLEDTTLYLHIWYSGACVCVCVRATATNRYLHSRVSSAEQSLPRS